MASRSTLAVMAMLACSSPVVGRDLQSADIYSADHPTVQSVEWLGQRLEERTGGRHRVVSLGEDNKSSEVFILGLARLNVASLSTLVPAAFVPAMPGVFRSTEHMQRVLDGPIGEELLAALDRFDLVGLCFYARSRGAAQRHHRLRRRQLAGLRRVASLRGRALLQPDAPFDGAGGAGILQARVGHAARGRPARGR